jgi:sugar/nucleoside kinase (ribokinase family)
MTLIELIKQHAQTAANAGNWSAVAETIRGLSLRQPSRKCGSVETAAALAAVGVNWAAVMDVIDDDSTGRFILTMLAAEGVQWGHALTVPYLRSKQGSVLTAPGVDALINLSSPLLYANLTAGDCQAALQAESDRLAAIEAERLSQQAAAMRSARVASIQSLDAVAIINGSEDLDAAVSAIRSHLASFGGW